MIAIEHPGKGHIDQSSAVAAERSKLRNEVKTRVLEKAGIRLLETEPGTSKVAAMGMVYATVCEALDDDAASDG